MSLELWKLTVGLGLGTITNCAHSCHAHN